MCGIFLNISEDTVSTFDVSSVEKLIKNRGPDSINNVDLTIGNKWKTLVIGSVLWTQGDNVCTQPIFNDNGSFLLWNGDVFNGLPNTGCDTQIVFEELLKDCLSTFSKIRGPYAFIYFDAITNLLWFGRDPVGRHSLLCNLNSKNLLLSSVSCRSTEVEEIPCCGIFKIDLSQSKLELQLHPWSHINVESFDLKYPYKRCCDLYHPSFMSPVNYKWYEKEPQPEDVAFLSGNTNISIFEHFTSNPPISILVEKAKELLMKSVRRRVETKPNYCKNCISSLCCCNHTKIGILFSGGLDSTILALLTNFVVPMNESIDLYNVAFDRCTTNKNAENDKFLVPDRKNGYESLKELKILAPDRKWNFVKINVDGEELDDLRNKHVADLIYPLTSILDDSLGCALWFAARGKGILNDQAYTSPARIVILGMGADEIFGGYSRHRKEFKINGWSKLGLLLAEEVRNIGKRNLGRDNRIVTDHGRQPRLPFLDEDVLQFANSLPPWLRCCLSSDMPPGTGDKLLLRSLAWNLGLRYSSSLPKKALQFGSRIANPKEKGHALSERLLVT